MQLLKGAHARLNKGTYNAFFRLNLLSVSASPIADLEVTTLDGRRMHGYRVVHGKEFATVGMSQVFSVPFVCDEDDLTFEFRVKSLGGARFTVDRATRCRRDVSRATLCAVRDWVR